jgi:Peptidase S24-like
MDALRADQLQSIASLWKSTGRSLVTSFTGGSMQPTIAPGERVMLRCTDQVKAGDVAAVVLDTDVFVHRVVAVSDNPPWWLFRGDANLLCDLPVMHSSAILGVVEGIERGGTFVPLGTVRVPLRTRLTTGITIALMRVWPVAANRILQFSIATRRLFLAAYNGMRSRI